VWKRFSLGAAPGQHTAPFLYYLVIDALVDDVFPIIDELSDQIETLESEIIRNFKGNELPRLLRVRRLLTSMRRILAPERDMIAVLLRHGDPRFDEQTSVYFRDVYDHLVRAFEQLEVERDLLGNATDAYHSALANRTNDIMKQLTIFASIFLPLSFVTGLFGENFDAMPFASRLLFFLQIVLLLGLPAGMLYWFRRKGWL
jgi:magnesium transporter